MGTPRARRAVPLIAAALTVIVVAGFVWLRANAPPPAPVYPLSSPTPVVAAQYSVGYDFLTHSLGWAVVTDQLKGEMTWVFKTTDAANHWIRIFEGPLSPPGARIRFLDQNHGYMTVLFDHVYAFETSDGGVHWSPMKFPAPPLAITFADSRHAWFVSFSATGPLDLYASGDGGISWTQKTFPPAALDGYGKGGEPALNFRPDGEGWLGAASDAAYVYLTTDGGGTWQTASIPVPPSAPPTKRGQIVGPAYTVSVQMLPGEGVLAVVRNETTSFESGYASFNQGSAWGLLSNPPSPAVWSDVSFLTRQDWWVFRFGYLFKTADAGVTWQETRVAPLIEGWNYSAAYPIDKLHAWSLMTSSGRINLGTALAMTSDGGASWHTVNVPQPG